jgi:hypothetical protein
MNIAIHPELELKIRSRAESEGMSIEEYLERLVRADQQGADELEALAIEGLESGTPIEVGPSYWSEKHKLLDKRLKQSDRP